METIKSYLDNMFAGLPKTTRVIDLKNNILSNMEEKYLELKSQGKSENEAIGIVISEFGNIDELVNELGIRKEEASGAKPVVTKEEVYAYLAVKKTVGIQTAIGVFLCILAPALLILTSTLIENGILSLGIPESASGIPGVIILLVLITIAVGIFIYSGMSQERYRYMESGVQLPHSLEQSLIDAYHKNSPKYHASLIFAIGLIILSPITLVTTSLVNEDSSSYGVVVLLFLVAVAVFVLITGGITRETYQRLLGLGDYSERNKKENKVIGAVAAIVWPLATIIFFISGFVYDYWSRAWIVFPITGILFGMFSAAYNIITNKDENYH